MYTHTVKLCTPAHRLVPRCCPQLSAVGQVGVYDLWAKSVTSIMPSLDMFTITNTSVVQLPSKTLILRFRRSFDATFNLESEQVGP